MPRSKVMMNVKQGFQVSVENVNVLLPVINPIVMYLQVESDTKNFFYRRDVLWTYEDKLFQGDVASVPTNGFQKQCRWTIGIDLISFAKVYSKHKAIREAAIS